MSTSNSRQLIDWHTHCSMPDHTSASARATMKAHGVVGGVDWPEHHRCAIEQGGVAKFVVICSPRRPGHVVPNEFIAEYVSQYQGRAVGLASVNPNDPHAPKEFETSIKSLGLKGLKLSPVYQTFDPWS